MTVHEIRQKYIDFFVKKGHKEISAAKLLAENDPTLLFVNSGMFPLVPYLMGQEHPSGKRLVNVQRSFRTDDILEVGDHRHSTFFEMLGNWSLGDYFKEEQLNWWYEFLIEELGLDINRIYSTVFAGDAHVPRDDESIEILKKIYKKYAIDATVGVETLGKGDDGPGVPIEFGGSERIFPYRDKNWWQRGDAIGELGGPDSETFYDTGKEHDKAYGDYCHVNCDCGRFIEIGNSVFMQYKKTEKGWEELPQKNVDFGGGLERLTMVVQEKNNIFETDVFASLLKYLEDISEKSYKDLSSPFEIICDHTRAVVFLIADGGVPSNKDQGYFVRRLLRRVLVYLHTLNISYERVTDMATQVIEKMSQDYPYLQEQKQHILSVIDEETKRFSKTVKTGMKHFETFAKDKDVSAQDAFLLVTTYGFPIELILELAQERGLSVDIKGYEAKLKEHQDLSRSASESKFKGGLADAQEETIKLHTATHLLHEALRQVLGEHVEQKGSNITVERLRFDFSHPQKMTKEEIQQVEDIVNEQIQKGLEVFKEEMSVQQAKESGAIGLFEDTYGEKIDVYSIGAPTTSDEKPFSREICGGPHVKNLSELGVFKIKKEEASSAGVRRIKAVLK